MQINSLTYLLRLELRLPLGFRVMTWVRIMIGVFSRFSGSVCPSFVGCGFQGTLLANDYMLMCTTNVLISHDLTVIYLPVCVLLHLKVLSLVETCLVANCSVSYIRE